MNEAIRISPLDNVAVALKDLPKGFETPFGVKLAEDVPAGHKFALSAIASGSDIVKYGAPIGHALKALAPGEWVHAHNLKTNLSGELDYVYKPASGFSPPASRPGLSFEGYLREDGRAGVRNEIWIIPTVGCVNKMAERLAAEANAALTPSSGVDGVFAFSHPYGCSQLGDDHEATRKILAALATHPNAGGALILGLGCENNVPASFMELLGDARKPSLRLLVVQDVGDELVEGRRLLAELAAHASKAKRTKLPLNKLAVGLKCGASDGFSGISANPLLGRLSDLLAACGGTPVLTEVPEMFGAELPLMDRCVSREVFDKCVAMVNGFKAYFQRHGQVVYENPSPGNKKGGISTLEDKSLGCTQKGGLGPVVDVVPYGGKLEKPGLNLLDGPGNDIVATTALVAAGAQIVLFTTGRGTPLGGPVPTVKVSTNSALARKKPNWIDFDAGPLLDGEPMDAALERLLALVLDVASGRAKARNEVNGYREIAIFKDGVTL